MSCKNKNKQQQKRNLKQTAASLFTYELLWKKCQQQAADIKVKCCKGSQLHKMINNKCFVQQQQQ